MTKTEQNIISILTSIGISTEDAHSFFNDLKKEGKGWNLKSYEKSYLYLIKTIPKTSNINHDKHKKNMRLSNESILLKNLLDKYEIKYSTNYSVNISGGMSSYYKVKRIMNISLD